MDGANLNSTKVVAAQDCLEGGLVVSRRIRSKAHLAVGCSGGQRSARVNKHGGKAEDIAQVAARLDVIPQPSAVNL